MVKTARILGTGSYLPKKKVNNKDLEKIVRNFDIEKAGMEFVEWAEAMTGIRERYYAEDEDAESMGAEAAKRALGSAGMNSSDVDFIIASSFTPTRDIPNLACSIGHLIGADTSPAFPLNTACAGFIYGLAIGYSLIKSELYKNVLVVATEVLSKATDFGDPKTAVLFGDGAGAAILEASDGGGIVSPPYLASEFSSHFELRSANISDAREILTQGEKEYIARCYIKMPGGPKVLKRAINAMADAAMGALEKSPWKLEEVDYIIPHQANQRITLGLIEKLKVPPDKVCSNIARFGNTSGASVAIALDKAVRGEIEEYQIKRGDKIVLTSIGGGYSLAGMVMEY